jgi:hypothetical protein
MKNLVLNSPYSSQRKMQTPHLNLIKLYKKSRVSLEAASTCKMKVIMRSAYQKIST